MVCFHCNSSRLVCDNAKDAYVCLDCAYEYPKQFDGVIRALQNF